MVYTDEERKEKKFKEEVISTCFFTLQVWDIETLELIKTISGLHHWVRALALDPMKVCQIASVLKCVIWGVPVFLYHDFFADLYNFA